MKTGPILAGFLLMASSSSLNAYFDTGNALLTTCQGITAHDGAQCLGTIIGHYDMMLSMGYDCGNDTLKNKQQIRDVVIKYLRDNPATRNSQAASLSFFAFLLAFDCKFPEATPKKK